MLDSAMKGGGTMNPIETGKLIRTGRKRHNLTQRSLGEKLNVSDKAVSKWERGISHS